MAKERRKEYKPLSFSTTMRNPARIAAFLNCILPYEGHVLTSDIIHEVAVNLIMAKLYYTEKYEMKVPEYKRIYKNDDLSFTREQVEDIIANSPQDHKEAGFEKGWDSRFDTWYKLPMEFGFIYYEMGKPITISQTGHMLIDAFNEVPANDIKIQNVFLNALMKYQTGNPFRKNANDNVPLVLLLQVIKFLKDDPDENDAGILRDELSLIICWPDKDSESLYKKIKELRAQYGYNYSDEVIYDECLQLLGAGVDKKKRFKIEQITGEAVDEFIRKMRITGIISLRGNGRFLDFNQFEVDKINYILENYSTYTHYASKEEYFRYMGSVDAHILTTTTVQEENIDDVRTRTLNEWATSYDKQEIFNELLIACGKRGNKGESRNPVLRIIDKPTRFEFLTSIALKQNFEGLKVCPNYHVDDEGLPTFTASGGFADIECYDTDCNLLVEVTLITARTQATMEMPAITRHLQEAVDKYPNKIVFSILVAPTIHADTKYMAGYSKYQYNVDILTFTTEEFVNVIDKSNKILNILRTN